MKNPTVEQVKEFIREPFSFPGGYQKLLVMTDGALLCHTCAADNFQLIADATRERVPGDQWAAAGVQLHLEGEPEECAHCYTAIHAAYCDCQECEPGGDLMNFETIEYSVCEDCLFAVAYGENGHDIGAHIERELNGRKGHFCAGVEATDDDPDGSGYDEFSYQDCELCRSGLGGSRYGVTLLIREQEATQ